MSTGTETTHEKIRREVADAYARAVNRPAPQDSCCGRAHKGAAVQSADYTADDLERLPDDAVTNAFGCGNPLAFADVKPGEVVLDLGSGAGIDLLIAAKKVGPDGRVIGVDMTDDMIERARQNIAESGATNVEVRQGLIEELPVEAGSVDLVISNCVINLSPEKDRVFAEIARVLKPGGRISISDIVVEELPELARNHSALYCGCVAGAISEADYRAGLERAGLAEVEVTSRLVYDARQLESILASELPEAGQASADAGCGCGCAPAATALSRPRIRDLARDLAGQVRSARFTATKPRA